MFFRSKLYELFQSSLARNYMKYFPNLKKMASVRLQMKQKKILNRQHFGCLICLVTFIKTFKKGFQICSKSEPLLQLALHPFNADPVMISNTAVHYRLTDIDFELNSGCKRKNTSYLLSKSVGASGIPPHPS